MPVWAFDQIRFRCRVNFGIRRNAELVLVSDIGTSSIGPASGPTGTRGAWCPSLAAERRG